MGIPPQLLPWILGVLGALIGSFLNVCIHRLPQHKSVVTPPSACPACGARVRAWQNIPVVSYLLLRGRCASCGAPISLRYPLVEILTTVLFLAAWAKFGSGRALAEALVFLAALIVLFFTDLDERILPDMVTLPGIIVGLVFAFFRPFDGSPGSLDRGEIIVRGLGSVLVSALVAAAAALVFWLLGRFWRILRPEIETAMGLGDVKLIAMIGAFLGAPRTLLTIFLGSLLGTLLYLLSRALELVLPRKASSAPAPLRPFMKTLEAAGFLVDGRGAGLMDLIPFGSMLAVGAAVSLFFGNEMLDAYLRFAGIRGR